MNSIWTRRIGAAGGAVYVLLGLLRGDGGSQLGFHATRQQIVAWIHTNSSITAGRYVTALLELFGLLCFLIFVAYLSGLLRRAEGEFGYLWTVALGAGILSVAIKISSFPASVVALVWARDGVDPRVIGMLFDMGDVAMVLTLMATGLMLAAVAVVAIPTGVLPRWLGWGTAATSVALFGNVTFAYASPDFSPAMFVFMLWTLVTSVLLIRRAGAPARATETRSMREPAMAR